MICKLCLSYIDISGHEFTIECPSCKLEYSLQDGYIPDINSLVDKINRLEKENKRLKCKIGDLENPSSLCPVCFNRSKADLNSGKIHSMECTLYSQTTCYMDMKEKLSITYNSYCTKCGTRYKLEDIERQF